MIPYLIVLSLLFACALNKVEQEPAMRQPAKPEVITEESILARANHALATQDDLQAYRLYEEYLVQFPKGAKVDEVLMQKGVIAETRGELERALIDFSYLCTEYPESPWAMDAHQKILEILFKQRKYDRVIQQADEALSVVKENAIRAKIYWILGETHMLRAAYVGAVKAYAEAYNLGQGDFKNDIALKLGAASDRLDTVYLRSTLDDLAEGPARGELLFILGNRLMVEEQYPDALRVFTEFVELYPDSLQNSMAHKNIADLGQMAVNRDTIGCLFPLSGPYSQFGSRALNGVELALHQFSAASLDPSVRIIVKDTGADPEKALSAFQELVDADVKAIIGPMVTAEAVAEKAQELGIPLIALTQKENIPQIGDYIFRNYITPQIQTEAIVYFAVHKLGINRFAILYPSDKYGITFMHQFWDRVLAHGGELTRMAAYDPEKTDFAEAIKKLIGSYEPPNGDEARPVIDFEAIFIPDAPEKAGLVIPQIAYHDIEGVYLFGTNLWYSQRLVEMAQQFLQGSILPVGFFPEASSWRVVGFVDEFMAVFGEKPGFIEAVAYDTAKILFEIITRSETSYRSLVRDELLQLLAYPGVSGITTFQSDGDVEKKLYLLSVKGDQFIELEQ
jgi:ABC-type branched-subunit amino acid transport system substrate-binding protein